MMRRVGVGLQTAGVGIAGVVAAALLAAGCGLLALCLKERGLIRAIVVVFAVTPL